MTVTPVQKAVSALWMGGQNRGYDPILSPVLPTLCSGVWETGRVNADVAELADATDLGSVALRGVEVQILSSALSNLSFGLLGWVQGANQKLQVGNYLGPVA